MIAIIDYGMGNTGSLVNMLRKIGFQSIVTSDVNIIKNAYKVILPGVGAFDTAINRINNINGLRETLITHANVKKTNILGICLGMQLLTKKSEEGVLPGLNFIDAKTLKLPQGKNIKIPHMGWNTTKPINKNSLLKNFKSELKFYFVHSYYVSVKNKKNISMLSNHGIEFPSAFEQENIFGVQFHPEKSHKFGMQLLENFCKL